MDYVECPTCGRAYTWTYIYGRYARGPEMDREHTIVCHCGTEFDFAVYEDREDEDLTETIEEFIDKKWWAPGRRPKPVIVTAGVPRRYMVMHVR